MRPSSLHHRTAPCAAGALLFAALAAAAPAAAEPGLDRSLRPVPAATAEAAPTWLGWVRDLVEPVVELFKGEDRSSSDGKGGDDPGDGGDRGAGIDPDGSADRAL